MEKKKLFNTALLLICLGFVAACQEKTKSTVKYEYINNPNTGGTDGRDADGTGDDGTDDGSTGIPPYPISSNLIVFKTGGSDRVLWSSKNHLPSTYSQSVFDTNSRFKVRIRPRYVSQGTTVKGYYPNYEPINSLGQPFGVQRIPSRCHFIPQQYTSLTISAELVSPNIQDNVAGANVVTFTNAKVNQWSAPQQFHENMLPPNSPFNIRFKNPTWECSTSGCVGDTSFRILDYECISFDMEVVTDSTNDF